MANIIKLLDLLKWNTDECHPLTQEKLRELSPEADECMGYKSTFKRQLLSIAETLNSGKIEQNWKIVFPGYKLLNVNKQHYYTGPIFYRHEITNCELQFIIGQIQGIPFEQKAKLILKLIKIAGNKYFSPSASSILETEYINDIDAIDFTDSHIINKVTNIISTSEFATCISDTLYSNLSIIRDAIARKKLLSFLPSIINENGKLQTTKYDYYLVSPYRIILYKGFYWLLGNRRLKSYKKEGWNYNLYSNTIDVYRIDKLVNLSIARKSYELRAKTEFITNPDFESQLNILSSKIYLYKDNTQIAATSISDNYGLIEFEILWHNFSNSQVRDYSFIFDTFGHNFSIRYEVSKTIASVYSTEDCFIDWALCHINKIKILKASSNVENIKSKIKKILHSGLENLQH